MSSMAKLTYFPGRGKAEVVRLMLAAAGIEWEEEHLADPEHVTKIRKDGTLMFQQFPLLKIDGMNLVQTMATLRYLANKHGFMGKTPEEKVKIDMLADGARDWLNLGFPSILFYPAEKQDEFITTITAKTRSRYLPSFEKVLKENGSNGFLVGDSLTMADIVLFDPLTWVWEMDESLVREFPCVKMFYDNLTSHHRIQGYLKGPQRFALPDKEYVKGVKHILYGQ